MFQNTPVPRPQDHEAFFRPVKILIIKLLYNLKLHINFVIINVILGRILIAFQLFNVFNCSA